MRGGAVAASDAPAEDKYIIHVNRIEEVIRNPREFRRFAKDQYLVHGFPYEYCSKNYEQFESAVRNREYEKVKQFLEGGKLNFPPFVQMSEIRGMSHKVLINAPTTTLLWEFIQSFGADIELLNLLQKRGVSFWAFNGFREEGKLHIDRVVRVEMLGVTRSAIGGLIRLKRLSELSEELSAPQEQRGDPVYEQGLLDYMLKNRYKIEEHTLHKLFLYFLSNDVGFRRTSSLILLKTRREEEPIIGEIAASVERIFDCKVEQLVDAAFARGDHYQISVAGGVSYSNASIYSNLATSLRFEGVDKASYLEYYKNSSVQRAIARVYGIGALDVKSIVGLYPPMDLLTKHEMLIEPKKPKTPRVEVVIERDFVDVILEMFCYLFCCCRSR